MERGFLRGRTGIAPLVVLRIAFGVLMATGMLRFRLNGWIDALYVKPSFFFSYYGFEWVRPLGAAGMHAVFAVLLGCAVCIALGLLYRVASVLFFVLFTYVELIDRTNYLNHYYFISLLALLLCVVPAHCAFSLDVRWGLARPAKDVPLLFLRAVQLQPALVYLFAGIAKMNPDWLLHAQPLRIWLHARADLPLLGPWLQMPWVAFVFSWCGMLFDTCIAFFLFRRRTALPAYAVALVFHALTAWLFPGIGMFPYVMMACALVFLPEARLRRVLLRLGWKPDASPGDVRVAPVLRVALPVFFAVQLLLPLRFLLYPGQLFYNEEGYRFSWRVMLMEKAGTVFFTLRDPATGRRYGITNSDYLTRQQEKQMSTQPDMILQFAHHLHDVNAWRIPDAEVYAEAYVGVNGHGSRPFIDPHVDLAKQTDGLRPKTWVYDE
jgi:hypothetical protein